MRRFTALVSIFVIILLGGLNVASVAQVGTPQTGDGLPEGMTLERLGFGRTETLPAAPAEFQLVRVVIEPGGSLLRPIPDTGTVALFYIESGTLTLQFDGPLHVTRAASMQVLYTGVAPAQELVPAGTAVTLEAGDSVVLPSTAAGEIRNEGDEPVVYFVPYVYHPDA